jgi:acetyltransferase-like isoleucine patch superfamily enzyme
MLRNAYRKLFHMLPWHFSGLVFRIKTLSFCSPLRFRLSRVGKNSYIDPSVQIVGWNNVSVGSSSTISEDTWLNVNFRENSDIKIKIGNNCHIGRRNFFSSGPLIHIKDYGFTGLDCQFLGSSHVIDSPLVPYIKSGLTPGGIIEIGVNCWLATSVTVMENVKIGYGSVVGARSLVLTDLPRFCIAYGNPCKVIKRFDFQSNKWLSIADWDQELEKYYPSEDDYLNKLTSIYRVVNPSLISGSRRFGWL